jgi:hypothetical protein
MGLFKDNALTNKIIDSSNGWNLTEIKKLHRQNLFGTILEKLKKIIAVGSISSGILYLTVDYLARIPRERSEQGANKYENAAIGGSKVLAGLVNALTTPDLEKKSLRIPSFDLSIDGKELDLLNSNLPDSGREYRRGFLKIDKDITPVNVRYRGDSLNHWAFPERSWRIKTRKSKVIKDEFGKAHTLFNLYLPRTPSRIGDYIGYYMGNQIGLLSPESYPINLFLNRKNDGVRIFLEQVDQGFLARRNLSPNWLYIGDITTEQIYGKVKRKPLFHDESAWEIIGPNLDQGVADVGKFGEKLPLQTLLSVVNRERNLYDFLDKVVTVVNVPETLKYMALLDIVGSMHVDDTHNHKWYVNPDSGLLQPIVWDMAPYFWNHTRKLDNGHNQLFKVLLNVPELQHEKNKEIWSAIKGPLKLEKLIEFIDAELPKINGAVHSDPFKLVALHTKVNFLTNEKFLEGVSALRAAILQRHSFMHRELIHEKVSGSHYYDTTKKELLLSLTPEMVSGAYLEEISFKYTGTSKEPLLLERVAGPKNKVPKGRVEGIIKGDRVYFNLGELLYYRGTNPTNRVNGYLPAKYHYRITGLDGEVKDLKITLKNGITKEPLKENSIQLNNTSLEKVNEVPNGWYPKSKLDVVKRTVLAGDLHLKEDLNIGRDVELYIAKGTQLKIDPGVTIIINGGSLRVNGTSELPVIFRNSNNSEPRGPIALINAGKASIINHANFIGGRAGGPQQSFGRAYFKAPLNVIDSNLRITNSHFENCAIYGVRSQIIKEDVTESESAAFHTVSMADEIAFGTSPRKEREYRFEVTGSIADGMHVSTLLQDALAESIRSNPEIWEAPKFTNTSYRISDSIGEALYRDIYLDTADRVGVRDHVSYRLRNRFKTRRVHDAHIKHPKEPTFWPYRIEFQGKTGRERLAENLTEVTEARFEFRRQSLPFSFATPPPPPPWPLPEYLKIMQSGRFNGWLTTPAKSVMEYLRTKYSDRSEYLFEPSVVLVTTRYRQHLEIKSAFGSGPNPDQAYIITLDDTEVFEPKSFLAAVNLGWQDGAEKVVIPQAKGRFFELEIEFERNVSDKLDQELAKATVDTERERLTATLNAFLNDQKEIVSSVSARMRKTGINLKPVFRSKYRNGLQYIEKKV